MNSLPREVPDASNLGTAPGAVAPEATLSFAVATSASTSLSTLPEMSVFNSGRGLLLTVGAVAAGGATFGGTGAVAIGAEAIGFTTAGTGVTAAGAGERPAFMAVFVTVVIDCCVLLLFCDATELGVVGTGVADLV